MDAVPSSSYLALSHVGLDLLSPETRQGLEGVANKMMQQGITYRTREQVARFFDGTDLVDPGLVRVEEWRPAGGTADTERSSFWCAAGRKH
jgi:S-adenosyl methyltransferase